MSDEIRAELQRVDDELADLRRTSQEIRQRVGARDDGPSDPADGAAVLTEIEEQEALISALETRRAGLERRLSASGDSPV